MPGVILLINDLHKAAAEAIAKRVITERAKLPKSYKFILGISGESGSGKAEVAHSIAIELKKEHIRVKVLRTDNYYIVPPLLLTEWRKTKGIESVGINEYDWNLLSRNIQDFKEDRESMLPWVDAVPEQVDKLITDFKKVDLLIVSGLYAIKADGVDLRVFIELNYHEVQTAKNKDAKVTADEFKMKVYEKEHLNVLSLKPLTDLIINKGYQVVVAKTGEAIM